ncbi:MAG: collagenase [Rhodothermaceae bacterium]
MKKLLSFILITGLFLTAGWAQEPIGMQKTDNLKSVKSKVIPVEPVPPGYPLDLQSPDNRSFSLAKAAATYDLAYLSTLSYQNLVDLLVTIEWSDISDLFKWTSGAITFYSDQNRIDYIISAVQTKGAQFTTSDNKGIPTLIEVLRSGFYLAFYNNYSATNYLKTRTYHDTCIPSMLAIINNPNFGLGTTTQDRMVRALGLYIANASANVNVINALVPLFQSFNANISNYITVNSKAAAIWQVGDGLHYDLVSDYLYHNPDATQSPFYNNINNFLEEVYDIAEYGTLGDSYEYVINNAVYWTARFSPFVNGSRPNQVLTNVITIYGKWVMASVEAARGIVDRFNGVDYNGGTVDFDQVKAELKQQLLPNTAIFDNGKVIFNYGGNVDSEKIKKLYWAQREVRAQFHRAIRSDQVLDPANPDSILTVVIYNSPKEYDFNRILNNLSTNNGGIYIEGRGTFYTYERTPQQSIYTLEDLFRHEFTHYMQGRFMEPGPWGGSLYSNDRVTWLDEGSAEFFAGSSRLYNVRTRKAMAEGIASNVSDRMTLPEVLSAGYSSGFKFYTYGFVFVDYMYKHRLDILFNLVKHLKNNDAVSYDNYVNQLKADAALNQAYMNHMAQLKANSGSFVNPSTSGDYLASHASYSNTNIFNDVTSVASLTNANFNVTDSQVFDIIKIEGHYTGINSQGEVADWQDMTTKVNTFLNNLNSLSWSGYKTFNCYFKNHNVNSSGKYEFDIVFEGLATETGGSQNQIPVAVINGPYSGQIGQSVNFSSQGSNDPDGSIVEYTWDFGDGTTSNQQNATHTYSTASTFTVKLTVKDNIGATAFVTTTAVIADTSSGGNYISSETEPNNSFADANGAIGSGVSVSGDLGTIYNNDYFYFDISSTGTIDISLQVTGGGGANWLLYHESDQSQYVAYPSSGLTGSYNATQTGRYYILVYNYSGTGTYTLNVTGGLQKSSDNVLAQTTEIPETFELHNAYPNPFNPTTRIDFSVAEESWVKVTIYNMLGEVVKELVNEASMKPGKHTVIWNGTNQENQKVASGIYIYNFKSKQFNKSKKVLLLK